MSIYFLIYFIFMNIFGLYMMHNDKERAKKGKWRIQERTLMLIAILGGSIGSYIGMKKFRHKTKHAKFKYGIPIIIIIQIIMWLYIGNNFIVVSRYELNSRKFSSDFRGFKIIQISDLHNKVFPLDNAQLKSIINREKPDVIFITGDLVDRRKYNDEIALKLINEIKEIAPIYYVAGNHEAWSGKFGLLEEKLKQNGVIVLRNESLVVDKGEDKISILGIDDPAFNTTGYKEKDKDYTIAKENLEKIKIGENFNILLTHRPELLSLYAEKNIDLVFAGHAHGGQVILPIVGGLVAPNQGLLPKYFTGKHREENTSMIVSRGLGNSIAPIRVFNKPEVVVVTVNKF